MKQSDKTTTLDIRGVIFDMDGLLLDTEAMYLKAWPPVGEMMGLSITEDLAYATVGRGAKETEEVFQAELGEAFTIERARPFIGQWIMDYVAQNSLEVKPGARELVELLRRRAVPMAVGSSNIERNVRAFLEEAKLLPYFDTIVTADLVEHAKPAPDIFLQAAKNLGLAPSQCIVFEDSPTGVEAAHMAGCVTIMVPDLVQPCDVTKERCFQIISSLEEAPALFLQ